jgi:endoglucanase
MNRLFTPLSLLLTASLSIPLGACQPRRGAPAPNAAQQSSSAKQPHAAVAPILSLKRCVNLGNALDAPSEGEWGVVLSEDHFSTAKAAGFDHVRLPVRFSAHADQQPPYTIDAAFFARVDWALAQAKNQALPVILDVHHYNELTDEPDAQTERFIALWKQIAERYASQPETLIFELLNEPNKNLNPVKLNALHKRAIATVRATNPTRIIMVDSYFWANTNYLRTLELPEDPNLVAQFHMYQPILFTHQGAPWMEPEYATIGVVFPAPPSKPLQPVETAQRVSWVRDWFKAYNTLSADRNPGGPKTIREEFDRASSYAQASGRRVYLGEFGAINNADMASRARYLKAVREEAESRNIAWCVWDDGGGFQLLKPQEKGWVAELKAALIP